MNNESVGKKIVEALKKQAETMDMEESVDNTLFEEVSNETISNDIFAEESVYTETPAPVKQNFFDDIEEEKELPERIRKRFAKDVTEWTKREAKGKLTGNGFFDNTTDKYIFTHKKTDGMLITVCSDKETTDFLYYHLPYPCN